ncbi:hypothetical protein GOV10_06165 [Candidatus Woesearchaeota archaeon]|nr:hypothetical protein [Candidatus Woesearchaeota archaeon]
MYYAEPKLEEVMIDNGQSIEERMTYFLDEADLRFHEGVRPMDVQMFFDCISDIYHSSYLKQQYSDEKITTNEQFQLSRVMNTCKYLEDCLKNPGIGWMQPDAKGMREFWKHLSKIEYLPLQKLN